MNRMTRTRFAAVLAAVALLGAACSASDTAAETPDALILLTHDSFALSEGTLDMFTEQTGIDVEVRTGGDAGTMLNQAILTKDNPLADVIFGIDNTFISRAIDNDLLLPHAATGVEALDDAMRPDSDLGTPIDFGDVCVNYDIAALEDAAVPPPASIDDLTDPTYRGMLSVQDPATSSPGLAFLIATVARYPEASAYDWRDYWEDLFANDVAVASDWSEAYYTQFTRAGGDRPLVVSYASSPPVEVIFGEFDTPPTGVITDGCFRQIEYAGILNGTEYPEAAGDLIDFLLSVPVQEDIPSNMFVYPTNPDAKLPEVFVEFTVFPDEPVIVDPSTVTENRERWIREWTAIARSG